MSAFFPRSFYNSSSSDPSFTPLFRLLDEFDSYSREANNGSGNNNSQGRHHHRGSGRHHYPISTFNPKFDVRETDTAYELHGELPGIEREKISIEFTDAQTLVIHGRTERSYSAGAPPAGLVEEGGAQSGAITEKGEEQAAGAATPKESSDSGEGGLAVAAKDGQEKKANKAAPFEKYWIQERSIGEFTRTFNFPGRIDQDGVSASLENGVLSLVVPKAKRHEARRIAIN
ncbi:hypothetical protein N0V88_004483 [Collariella sp. IMI 366227]|nr:hypothetical protein N0V88_004483 [Collariella sp. IMI 366227]